MLINNKNKSIKLVLIIIILKKKIIKICNIYKIEEMYLKDFTNIHKKVKYAPVICKICKKKKK